MRGLSDPESPRMKSRKLKNQDSWASRNYTGGATHVRSNWCRSLGLPCASLAPICSLQEMISLSVTPHQDTSGLTSQMVRFLASSSFIKCNLPFPRSSLTQAKNMKSSSVLPPLQLMDCPASISHNLAFLFPTLPPFKTHPGVPGTPHCPDGRWYTQASVLALLSALQCPGLASGPRAEDCSFLCWASPPPQRSHHRFAVICA